MGKCCFKSEDSEELTDSLTGTQYTSSSGVSARDFKFLKLLGRGAYGKVFLVSSHMTDELLALKVLKKSALTSSKMLSQLQTERDFLSSLDSPFLVKLRCAFQSSSKLYMGMEYMEGGELFFHLRKAGKFSEDKAKFYTAEIILGIKYLHQRDIIYRDLKPENVLLDSDGHIKLADFGLSKYLEEGEKTYTLCGTAEYLAPEVIAKKGYTNAIDVWAIGALLYEMLAGEPPFYSRNRMQMFKDITTKPLVIPEYVSAQAGDLLRCLLEKDVHLRMNHFDDVFNHSFFLTINWDKLCKKKIDPPLKPLKACPKEALNFDKAFTVEPPVDSVERGIPLVHTNFSNFTYQETGYLKRD